MTRIKRRLGVPAERNVFPFARDSHTTHLTVQDYGPPNDQEPRLAALSIGRRCVIDRRNPNESIAATMRILILLHVGDTQVGRISLPLYDKSLTRQAAPDASQ